MAYKKHMSNRADTYKCNISKWDTGRVTSMNYMFNQAAAFNGDISHWYTRRVTYMNYMFDSQPK